jgi:hypothetical protein
MIAPLALISLCLALGGTAGFAQNVTPSVKIGNHEIRLGLAADEVIGSLQKDYAVQPDSNSPAHKWFVSAGKNTIPIGVVCVKANVIVGVQYMLKGRESNSAQDIFDDLFEAASKLSDEGRSACTLTTWSGYVGEASLTKAGISFNCGAYQLDPRRIEISGSSGHDATGYMLWESLGVTD